MTLPATTNPSTNRKRARSFSFESDSTSITSSNSKYSGNRENVNLSSFSDHRFLLRSSRISGRNQQTHNSNRHNLSCNFRRFRREINDSSCSTSPTCYSLSSCDRSRFRKNESFVKSIFNRPNSPSSSSSSSYENNQSAKVIQTTIVVDKNYDAIYANSTDDNDDANAIFSTNHQSSAQSPSSITHTCATEDSKSRPGNKGCNETCSYYNFEELPMEWWERSPACKLAKSEHMDRLDSFCSSRERLVMLTSLWRDDVVLEPNMFPYATPVGIEHYTLWSVQDLSHDEIQYFVDKWLRKHHPQVRRWQYDDNSGERSFDIFHVHVFIEMAPFSFRPAKDKIYLPPHAQPCSPRSAREGEQRGGPALLRSSEVK